VQKEIVSKEAREILYRTVYEARRER